MNRSLAVNLALAAGVALLLATHVFVAIDLARFKIVDAAVSAAGGEVHASTAGFRVDELRPPFALIARIDNRAGSAAPFAVSIDGAQVCRVTLPDARATRFDCAVTRDWQRAADHAVVISGPAAPWRLEYLELATHHGGTSGNHDFVVLPAGSTHFTRVPLLWVLLSASMVFVVLRTQARPSSPVWLWRSYRVVAALIVAFFVLIVASDRLSSYKLVISAGSAGFWIAALLLPSLWRLGTSIFRQAGASTSVWRRTALAGFVAGIVLLAFYSLVAARLADVYHGNYSGFLFVSERAFDDNPLLQSRSDVRRSLILDQGGGYDAQFMYFAAFDPFLRLFRQTPERYRGVVDAPPYRYGRIGYVLLTIAASGGRWERYPPTMIWLILWSVAAAAFVLALLSQAQGMSASVGLLVVAVPGFWQSLSSGLPEPIAAAALLGGIACVWRERWVPAAVLFALSLLVRETGIVAMIAVLATPVVRRVPGAIAAAAFALGVFAAWKLYVMWALFADWGIRGLLYQPGDLTWPGAGFLELWRTIGHGQYYSGAPELSRAGVAYPLLLLGGSLLAFVLAARRPTPVHAAAAVYGLLAISLNYEAIWVHVGNGVRGTYELFLMLALVATGWHACSKPARIGLAAFWVAAAIYVAVLGQDAQAIRDALAVPLPI